MNGRIIRSSVIILTLVIAGGAWAPAQAPGVDVKFPFVAAGKTLTPARIPSMSPRTATWS